MRAAQVGPSRRTRASTVAHHQHAAELLGLARLWLGMSDGRRPGSPEPSYSPYGGLRIRQSQLRLSIRPGRIGKQSRKTREVGMKSFGKRAAGLRLERM